MFFFIYSLVYRRGCLLSLHSHALKAKSFRRKARSKSARILLIFSLISEGRSARRRWNRLLFRRPHDDLTGFDTDEEILILNFRSRRNYNLCLFRRGKFRVVRKTGWIEIQLIFAGNDVLEREPSFIISESILIPGVNKTNTSAIPSSFKVIPIWASLMPKPSPH